MDYALPRATDFPQFEMHNTVTPTPVNPLGAKGCGEAGTLGSTPSIVCAAVDALSEFGVKHIDMMLQAGEALADHHREVEGSVIPTRIRLSPRDVAGRCAGEDDGGGRERQVPGRRTQPGAADEAAAQRAGALIDIARIPELAGIREKDGQIEIGAATVHHAVATSKLLQERCPIVSDAAATIGDHAGAQPRHDRRKPGARGSVGRHAGRDAGARRGDPPAQRERARASVKATDFFQDLFTVDMQPDEIITAVRFAPVKAAAYEKLYQKASHYAIVGVAAALDVRAARSSRRASG